MRCFVLVTLCVALVAVLALLRSGSIHASQYVVLDNYDCLDNNSTCPHQGTCLSSGACECDAGWTGSECYTRTCGHGTGPDSAGVCSCNPNYMGALCLGCANDAACGNNNGTNTKCDNSAVTFQSKYMDCDVTNVMIANMIGSKATFHCEFPTESSSPLDALTATLPLKINENGSCYLAMWAIDNGKQNENFWCNQNDCELFITSAVAEGGGVDVTSVLYTCKSTTCNCTNLSPRCATVQSIVDSMKTVSNITCDNKGTCNMYQAETLSLGYFPLHCKSYECIPPDFFGNTSIPSSSSSIVPSSGFVAALFASSVLCFVATMIALAFSA